MNTNSENSILADTDWDLGCSPDGFAPELPAIAKTNENSPEASGKTTADDGIRGTPVKMRIANDPHVKNALAVAKKEQRKFLQCLAEFSPLLDREANAEAHKRFIHEAATPEELHNAIVRLAAVDSDAAHVARERAQIIVGKSLTEFTATLPALLEAAKSVVENLEIEAELAETA